ncbi:helix-turn-helix transcriptional regulator [Paraferrimonas sedimenticola]|uniref:DNA-binding protein n=1 Tax=Paraferrimonas sedimenticola TaxID=375674 RepID=A0AA37RYK3_9GAMM|nr:helix-turn-helix transcriptional regulator [Paraferrimonas sedimenticola]GLP97546.1 DNA-binding protein [Paraferrimonas sedimenticola]
MTQASQYLSARALADYLDLNEKKVYALANDGVLPGTKVTGKWMFPKVLIDRWLLDSCHSGLLSDRLLITGSSDPLMEHLVSRLMDKVGHSGLVSYSGTGSRQGLALLSRHFADICCFHWGLSEERDVRHPALLANYQNHQQWVLLHAYKRQYGLALAPQKHAAAQNLESLLELNWRWVERQPGSGSQQHLAHWLQLRSDTSVALNFVEMAYTEQQLTGAIASGRADIGFACQAAAEQAGLAFIPLFEESFDLVLPQSFYFRQLVQQLFGLLLEAETLDKAAQLGGYDLSEAGKVIWSPS